MTATFEVDIIYRVSKSYDKNLTKWDIEFSFKMSYAILGIKRPTYREWSKRLDPVLKRKKIGRRIIIVYQLIKAMVRDQGVPASEMSKDDWSFVFNKCQELPINELRKCSIVFDKRVGRLFFNEPRSVEEEKTRFKRRVYLDEIIDDHIDLLTRDFESASTKKLNDNKDQNNNSKVIKFSSMRRS